MKLLKELLRRMLGRYNLCRIYALNLDNLPGLVPCKFRMERIMEVSASASATTISIKGISEYAGKEAYGFGVWEHDKLIATCWFWHGERYKARNFWPLTANEAKLVQIYTDEAYRGLGIASSLIRFSSSEMKKLGFSRLYSRIWHSNTASVAAFTKAEWQYMAFVVEIFPFGLGIKWRFVRHIAKR